jgi:hypothetical protein
LRSGIKWLVCFLAGPVIFAAAGLLYWLQCGDPTLVDWLILTELGVVAGAYMIFVLMSLTDGGRLRDLNPVAVADLAHQLGWRGLALALAAALVFLLHGWALLTGVAMVHTEPVQGLLLVAGGWLSALYWSTFFCRAIGIVCRREMSAARLRNVLDRS